MSLPPRMQTQGIPSAVRGCTDGCESNRVIPLNQHEDGISERHPTRSKSQHETDILVLFVKAIVCLTKRQIQIMASKKERTATKVRVFGFIFFDLITNIKLRRSREVLKYSPAYFTIHVDTNITRA